MTTSRFQLITTSTRPVDVPVTEYKGQRVITLAIMDQVHQRPEGTARRNFNQNKSKLVECEDYFIVNQANEIRSLDLARKDGSTPASMILLTETGYLMIVKSFNDDLAWRVQRQLVKGYFRGKLVEKSTSVPDDVLKIIRQMNGTIQALSKKVSSIEKIQQEHSKDIEYLIETQDEQ